MPFGAHFEAQIFQSLKDKTVEVSLLGGHQNLLRGVLLTAQDDYIMIATEAGSPKNTYVIPASAVAYIRLAE